MPIDSMQSGSANRSFPTQLMNYGKSLIKKVVEFTTAFFRLIGITALYTAITAPFSRTVKKEEILKPKDELVTPQKKGAPEESRPNVCSAVGGEESKKVAEVADKLLNPEDESLAIPQEPIENRVDLKPVSDPASIVEEIVEPAESIDGVVIDLKDALLEESGRRLYELRSRVQEMVGMDASISIDFSGMHEPSDLEQYLATLIFPEFTPSKPSEEELLHEWAQAEMVRAIATCPLTQGFELFIIPSSPVNYIRGKWEIGKDDPELDRGIFSLNEFNWQWEVEPIVAVSESKDRSEKHLFVKKDTAQEVQPVPADLLRLLEWGVSLGFNPLRDVLAFDAEQHWVAEDLEPGVNQRLRKFAVQFRDRGNLFVSPYVRGEAFDLIYATVPDIQNDLLKECSSSDPKANCSLEIYNGERDGTDTNAWLEEFKEASRVVCATRPLTPYFRTPFNELDERYNNKTFKEACTKALEDTSDEAYKKYAEKYWINRSPLHDVQSFDDYKGRITGLFPEPFERLASRDFWDIQSIVGAHAGEMKESLEALPEVTDREKEIKQKARDFFGRYIVGLNLYTYNQFKQEMQALEYIGAYSSFAAQFNGLKKALEENPDQTVTLHIDERGIDFPGYKGKCVASAFYRVAREFQQWANENSCSERAKVVYTHLNRETTYKKSEEFYKLLRLHNPKKEAASRERRPIEFKDAASLGWDVKEDGTIDYDSTMRRVRGVATFAVR